MALEVIPPPQSTLRTPRLQVLVNKQPLTGVIEAEVEQTGDFAADTFRVIASLSALPSNLGLPYWADSSNVDIEILGGFIENGLPNMASWLSGRVDKPSISLVGRTLTLTGRDFSGLLFDTKTSEPFTDLTSSQIATQITTSQGLTPQVTQTTTKAGKLYQQFHCRLARERSQWDLLRFLAEVEGFDLYVRGRTLYFGPPVAASASPYVVQIAYDPQGRIVCGNTEVFLDKELTLADDVIVKVRSWNQKQQTPFTATLKSSKTKASSDPSRSPQTYTFSVPNLDQSQVTACAQARLAEITKHERVLRTEGPGDNLLQVRGSVQLIGTASSYDQLYYPVTVTRSISVARGYTMEMHAKNHSPRDVTQ